MPIESSQDDWDAVNELIAQGDLKSLNVNLAPAHETLMNTLKMVDHDANLSELVVANAKARLRMTTLYALGQANNYLVLGTDNLDE
jgi:NAD+ synthase